MTSPTGFDYGFQAMLLLFPFSRGHLSLTFDHSPKPKSDLNQANQKKTSSLAAYLSHFQPQKQGHSLKPDALENGAAHQREAPVWRSALDTKCAAGSRRSIESFAKERLRAFGRRSRERREKSAAKSPRGERQSQQSGLKATRVERE
jgi:hypothetical protein